MKATLTLGKEKCVEAKSHTAYSLWMNDLSLRYAERGAGASRLPRFLVMS